MVFAIKKSIAKFFLPKHFEGYLKILLCFFFFFFFVIEIYTYGTDFSVRDIRGSISPSFLPLLPRLTSFLASLSRGISRVD